MAQFQMYTNSIYVKYVLLPIYTHKTKINRCTYDPLKIYWNFLFDTDQKRVNWHNVLFMPIHIASTMLRQLSSEIRNCSIYFPMLPAMFKTQRDATKHSCTSLPSTNNKFSDKTVHYKHRN
jgi:hypothetical protein